MLLLTNAIYTKDNNNSLVSFLYEFTNVTKEGKPYKSQFNKAFSEALVSAATQLGTLVAIQDGYWIYKENTDAEKPSISGKLAELTAVKSVTANEFAGLLDKYCLLDTDPVRIVFNNAAVKKPTTLENKTNNVVEGVNNMEEKKELEQAAETGKGIAEKGNEILSKDSYKRHVKAIQNSKTILDAIENIAELAQACWYTAASYDSLACKALFDKMNGLVENLRNAKDSKEAGRLKKICATVAVAFIKTAELLIGTVKFGIDVVVILGTFIASVVKHTLDESVIAGYRIGCAFNNDILSVFKETEVKNIMDKPKFMR